MALALPTLAHHTALSRASQVRLVHATGKPTAARRQSSQAASALLKLTGTSVHPDTPGDLYVSPNCRIYSDGWGSGPFSNGPAALLK